MKATCTLLGCLAIAAAAASSATSALAEYKGAPRSFLFNPALDVCFHDTAKYKKKPPYVIGFANAGLGDSWSIRSRKRRTIMPT